MLNSTMSLIVLVSLSILWCKDDDDNDNDDVDKKWGEYFVFMNFKWTYYTILSCCLALKRSKLNNFLCIIRKWILGLCLVICHVCRILLRKTRAYVCSHATSLLSPKTCLSLTFWMHNELCVLYYIVVHYILFTCDDRKIIPATNIRLIINYLHTFYCPSIENNIPSWSRKHNC